MINWALSGAPRDLGAEYTGFQNFFLNTIFYLEMKRRLSLNYYCMQEILKGFFQNKKFSEVMASNPSDQEETVGVMYIYNHETM